MAQVVRLLVLCLQFATVIPTPQLQQVRDEEVRTSVVFWPLLGLGLGTMAYGIQFVCVTLLHLPALLSSALSISGYIVLTGALHVDGLMDTADAIGSRKPRDIALEIMKDSRVGAMGVMACVLVLLIRVISVANVPATNFGPFLVVPLLSRLAMVWSMALAPAARPQGLGSMFAMRVPNWVIWSAFVYALATCVLLTSPIRWIAAMVVALGMTITFTRWMRQKFGGMTGDTYGALNELLESVGWIVFLVH